jgi:hypothetical protein
LAQNLNTASIIVISDHGLEIANKSERERVIEDFKFLGMLPCVELAPSLELFKCEVIHGQDPIIFLTLRLLSAELQILI